MKNLPTRKYTRLKNHNYCQAGAYFVTFCVKGKHELLGKVLVGSGFHARPSIQLTNLGLEVQSAIEYIGTNDAAVNMHKFVIMPNHVHLIVSLSTVGDAGGSAVGDGTPTLQAVVGRIKSYAVKRWKEMSGTEDVTFWQRSFHDHIIRSETEYQKIWQYIDENPSR